MKRHLSLTSNHSRKQGDHAEAVAVRSVPATEGLALRGRARPHLTLADPQVWRHTLILTGTLDYRSACELEEEIECLCQEGVTHITLDLRQLEAIDSSGAQVVSFWSALCRRRGHDLAVLTGSADTHEALEQAGTAGLSSAAMIAPEGWEPSELPEQEGLITALVKEL